MRASPSMKELPVARGGVIIAQCAVDDDVFDKLVGRPISSPHVRIVRPLVKIDRRSQSVSRYVIGQNPVDDDTMVVDHIDGNPCNNIRSNLRWLSRSDNVRNQRSKTASGFRGVTKNGKKWQALFNPSNGKTMYGGAYETAKEAALAVDAMTRNALGSALDQRLLNFPEESSIKDLSHVKRLVPTGLPRNISNTRYGTYRIDMRGYPIRQVKTIEQALELKALYVKARDDAKLAKIMVDGKIALWNKAGTITGYTIVDDDMLYEVALAGPHLNPDGYVKIRVGGVSTLLHRYIYSETLENATVMPEMIDHINGDKLDNTRANLRASNASSNSHAKRKRHGTSSMYYGVTWETHVRHWRSSIKKDGITTKKRFTDELDAARFYNENAIRLYGTHAQLNELPGGLCGPTAEDDRGIKTASGVIIVTNNT